MDACAAIGSGVLFGIAEAAGMVAAIEFSMRLGAPKLMSTKERVGLLNECLSLRIGSTK